VSIMGRSSGDRCLNAPSPNDCISSPQSTAGTPSRVDLRVRPGPPQSVSGNLAVQSISGEVQGNRNHSRQRGGVGRLRASGTHGAVPQTEILSCLANSRKLRGVSGLPVARIRRQTLFTVCFASGCRSTALRMTPPPSETVHFSVGRRKPCGRHAAVATRLNAVTDPIGATGASFGGG